MQQGVKKISVVASWSEQTIILRRRRGLCSWFLSMDHGTSVDAKSTVGGGVQDIYGEDCATEDQLITPWTLSVARYFYTGLTGSATGSVCSYTC